MKNKKEWKRNVVSLVHFLFAIGFVIAFLKTINNVNQSNAWNNLMINIAIGLLAFVAIFFSLVLKKEIRDKIKQISTNEREKPLSEVRQSLNDLQRELDNKNPNYNKMLNLLKDSSDKITNITYSEKERDLNSKLFLAVISFIIVITVVLFDFISDYKIIVFGSITYFRSVGYFFIWIGLWNTLQIMLSWQRIIDF